YQDLQGVEAEGDGAVVPGGPGDAQEVRGHRARAEVQPAALGVGGLRGVGRDPGAGAGRGNGAEGDADRDGDQGGDREPEQCLPGQAGGIGDTPEVRDRGDDREEDQRRDQRLQQGHEDRADGLQGGGQPVRAVTAVLAGAGDRTHLGGHEAEDHAEDQPDQDLPAEGDADDRAQRVAPGRPGRGGGGGSAHERSRYAATLPLSTRLL